MALIPAEREIMGKPMINQRDNRHRGGSSGWRARHGEVNYAYRPDSRGYVVGIETDADE